MTRNSVRRSALVLTVVSVAAVAAACPSEDAMAPGTTTPPTPTPTSISVVSGDGQSATVGEALANPIVVQVNDQFGNPMALINVSFSVTQGGGSVTDASLLTASDGRTSTFWTLGTGAGSQQVTAAVMSNTNVNTTISATATADVAAALVEVSGNNQTQQMNAALPNDIVVRVDDQFGNPVQGQAVDFVVTGGTGSLNGMGSPVTVTTDANGEAAAQWTLGPEQPTQTVEAQATGLTGTPVVFNATVTGAAPASVAVSAGDMQTGLVNAPVNIAPAVLVEDAAGFPFSGATVTFAVASGGGMASGLMATTDASGVATVGGWTLGAAAGANTLTATETATGMIVTFNATGITPAFNIEVRDLAGGFTMTQQQAFDDAVTKWESLIIGDLADQVANVVADGCPIVSAHPAVMETIDDLVILAEIVTIDGVGSILGQAGFCFVRIASTLPYLGGLQLDVDDVADLETAGQLDDVILHEIGHVLGFGTLWGPTGFNFLQDPSATACAAMMTPPQTYFNGPLAIAAFDDLGGTGYDEIANGPKVPVENDCMSFGAGSLDSHWREGILATELMTPAVNTGVANPLSALSVASLADMGYVTNYSAADAFVVPGAAALVSRSAGSILLMNDAWRGPIMVTGPDGRVIKVITR